MICSRCKYPNSRVVSTDRVDPKELIQRRRECLRCGARYTTHEKMRDAKKPIDDRYPTARNLK